MTENIFITLKYLSKTKFGSLAKANQKSSLDPDFCSFQQNWNEYNDTLPTM